MKNSQVSVASEIDSEKEYKIVRLSDTDKDELFKNQKNKILIYSDSRRE